MGQILSADILDREAIEQLFEADHEGDKRGKFLIETVNLFRSSVPLTLVELKDALFSGNFARVCEKAHFLKSSCNIIGLMRMRSVCHHLEFLADSDLDIPSVESLLLTLENEFQTGLAVLDEELIFKHIS